MAPRSVEAKSAIGEELAEQRVGGSAKGNTVDH